LSYLECIGLLLKTTIKFLEHVKPDEVEEPESDDEESASNNEPKDQPDGMAIEIPDEVIAADKDTNGAEGGGGGAPVLTEAPKLEEVTHALVLRQCYACLHQIQLPVRDLRRILATECSFLFCLFFCRTRVLPAPSWNPTNKRKVDIYGIRGRTTERKCWKCLDSSHHLSWNKSMERANRLNSSQAMLRL